MKLKNTTTLFLILNICLFLFIASTHKSQETFDKITVKEFELVGSKGERRATIKVEESGEVVLRMMDQSGTIRVKIGASKDGSGLVLLDQNTEPAVHMLAKSDGGKLTLLDPNGKKKEY